MADANDPRLGGETLEMVLCATGIPCCLLTLRAEHGKGVGAAGVP
jgi:hypothetical protein